MSGLQLPQYALDLVALAGPEGLPFPTFLTQLPLYLHAATTTTTPSSTSSSSPPSPSSSSPSSPALPTPPPRALARLWRSLPRLSRHVSLFSSHRGRRRDGGGGPRNDANDEDDEDHGRDDDAQGHGPEQQEEDDEDDLLASLRASVAIASPAFQRDALGLTDSEGGAPLPKVGLTVLRILGQARHSGRSQSQLAVREPTT